MKTNLLVGALFALSATASNAVTLSFTGADLFNNPNVTLPSAATSLSGTSLVFGPGTASWEKLVVLPLSSLGQWIDADGAVVTASLNLTRLACTGSCIGGAIDHDPPIALGNGSRIVGTQISNNDNGSAYLDEYTDLGTSGSRVRHDILFTNSGFPEIGNLYDVEVQFTLNAADTVVDVTLLGGSGQATASAVGRPADLDFLFMSDDNSGEQYQLNTLSITSDALSAIPIPPAVWLFGSGLLGLIGLSKRKNNT